MNKLINILLVDDTKTNLDILKMALDSKSYKFHCAESGNEALKMMLQVEFALILLDIQMPNMDGYEVLRTMQLNSKIKRTPVILISAFEQTRDVLKEGYKSGAVDFLPKPFDSFVLNQKVKVFTDLYRQRKESELAKKSLEREVGIRKKIQDDLMEAILETRQLAKEANKATKAKSEFLANMSHEIRTPMNGIVGFTDILLEDKLTLEQRDMVTTIKNCSDSLLELINDILDFSKIEANQVAFESIPFDIEDIMYEANKLVSSKLNNAKVQLIVDVDSCATLVKGDPTRLRQILINLIGNAIKFTKEGRIVTKLKYLPQDNDKAARFKISVIDTGIGISEDQQDKIFKPFSQADGSTTREYGGTGLGLSISVRLAEAMGGKLCVSSEVGVGSEFYFEAEFESISTHDKSTGKPFAGKKILLLESDGEAINIYKSFLEIEGLEVDICCDLEELSSTIAEFKPDILIASVDMGLKDIKKIVKECDKNIFTVALTSDRSLENTRRIKASKFGAFFQRPLVRRDLLKRLHNLYDEVSSQDSLSGGYDSGAKTFENISVLMAEDNKINQKLQMRVLTKMGCKVDVANNGKEALVLANENMYDLVLMDMQMPEMDGVEATKQLRWADYKVPIIAMTANAFESDRQICFDAGMNDFITKPIKKDIVFETLRKHCKVTMSVNSMLEGKVLIVEDDPKLLKILQRSLQKQYPGLRIHCADDGIAASSSLGSFNPDLILTDLMMPKMDGVDLINYIKNEDQHADTTIIAITGADLGGDMVARARQAGVDEILTKPYKLTEIFEIVKNNLTAS